MSLYCRWQLKKQREDNLTGYCSLIGSSMTSCSLGVDQVRWHPATSHRQGVDQVWTWLKCQRTQSLFVAKQSSETKQISLHSSKLICSDVKHSSWKLYWSILGYKNLLLHHARPQCCLEVTTCRAIRSARGQSKNRIKCFFSWRAAPFQTPVFLWTEKEIRYIRNSLHTS